MAISFFDRELSKLFDRFNSTFGKGNLWHPETRTSTMFAILYLGILAKKIKRIHMNENARDLIKEFVQGKDKLNGLFDKAEHEMKGENHVEFTRQRHVSRIAAVV